LLLAGCFCFLALRGLRQGVKGAELEDDKFYVYEVRGGIDTRNSTTNKGSVRAVVKANWINSEGLTVSLVSEIAYAHVVKDLK